MKKKQLRSVITSSLLAILAWASMIPLANAELIAHYALDDNGVDSSIQANHATVLGPISAEDRNGIAAGALHFDGNDDRLMASDNAVFDNLNQFSLSVWIRTLTKTQIIVRKGSSPTSPPFDLSSSATGDLIFGVTTNGNHTQARAPFTADGEWHHVAGRYNGTTLSLFLDGNEIASESISGPLFSDTSPLMIGTRTLTTASSFLGDMDELRLYNNALTDAQILTLADPSSTSENPATPDQPTNSPSAGVNLGSGTASLLTGSQLSLANFGYYGTTTNAIIRLNTDYTWSLSEIGIPEPVGGLNLGTALVEVIGPLSLRLFDIGFADNRYDATISILEDGSWSLEQIGFTPERDDRRIGVGPINLYPNSSYNGVGVDVEQLLSLGKFIYASVRYHNGTQKLDIWDVSNPLQPTRVHQRDYGNYNPTGDTSQDYDLLPTLSTRNGYLILQTEDQLQTFRPMSNGRLESVTTDVSIALNGLENATFAGDLMVIPGAALEPDRFASITNPASPFEIIARNNTLDGPDASIAGSFLDNAAELSINDAGTQAQLTIYKKDISLHLDGFWDDKLSLLFPGSTLDRPLGALITDAVNSIGISQRLSELYTEIPDHLTISANASIDSMISASYNDTMTLRSLMTELNINIDDEFESSLRRVIRANLDANIGAVAKRLLIRPLWDKWLGETLGLDTSLPNINAIADSLSAVLNANVSTSEIAAYLAEEMLGPLLGNPPYITENLRTSINRVTDSQFANTIDTSLTAASNILDPGGIVNFALRETVQRAFDLVDLDIPAHCALPETAEELLNMALIDHLHLNQDGLALLEMLKAVQYFNDNLNYLQYELELDLMLKNMHRELALALSEGLSPLMDNLRYAGSIQERIEQFSDDLPGSELIIEGVSEVILAHLRSNGIDTARSTRAVLLDLNLYINNSDLPINQFQLSTIGDLRLALRNQLSVSYTDSLQVNHTVSLANLSLAQVFESARHEGIIIQQMLSQLLITAVQRDFGALQLDSSLRSVLKGYITRHIDLAGTFTATLQGIFGAIAQFAYDRPTVNIDDIPLLAEGVLTTRFLEEGSCYAGWQLYNRLATDIALGWSVVDDFASYNILKLSELLLQQAYDKSKDYFINRLIGEISGVIFGELLGSFDNLLSPITAQTYNIDLSQVTRLNPARIEAVLLGDRIGFVMIENRGSDDRRQVTLVTVNPLNPDDHREIELGSWNIVDDVHSANGVVLINGQADNAEGQLRNMAAFVDGQADNPEVTTISSAQIGAVVSMTLSDDGSTLILRGPLGAQLLTLTARSQ